MRFLLLILSAALTLPAQDLAILGATAHTMTGDPIENATIIVRGGLIEKVKEGLKPPGDLKVIEARGRHLYPGFVDGWTTLGLTEISSISGTVDTREMGTWNAHLRAAAAINPSSAHLPVARVNGITTAAVVPQGGSISGEVALLDLMGRTVPQMLAATERPALHLDLPRAPRRKPDETDDKYLERVEKGWKKLEQFLERAQKLGDLVDRGFDRAGKDLSGQERLSMLATARHRKSGGRWLIEASTRDEILAALRFGKKHDLPLVLGGLREGWTVTRQLKESGARLLVGAVFRVPGRDDPYDASYANPALMHAAGLEFGFMTGSASNVRNLPYLAAMAVAHGLPRDAAMRALTIGGARALGLDATHGSLQAGQVANLVLYSGDPLDARVSPDLLFIKGQPVPLKSRHTDLAAPHLDQ